MRKHPPVLQFFVALAALNVLVAPPHAHAQVTPESEVVAVVVDGVGFGHGRGMSQWGAFGRAVNGGQSWQTILGAYYGGTSLGSASTTTRLRVRLVGHDGDANVGVISITSKAMWGGVGYAALQARATATANRYDVWASPMVACPGASTTGWTRLAAGVAGPVRFSVAVNEASAPAGEVLGLCDRSGSVTHYRGFVQLTSDSSGNRRVVNDTLVESYLRGVVSREVSTSWGNSGGGDGMNALRAQAVAARSYGLSQNRYASSGGYAATCDSSACQAYGGAAHRSSPTASLSSGGTCESGNVTFECANTNRAVAETAGRVLRWSSGAVVAAEFSASNGPRTAGGAFPPVDDPFDDVPQNPNHRWTRVVDGDRLADAFGLGTLTSATTESDPTTPFSGIWDNRVRLVGTGGSVIVSAWNFRTIYGLPSPGFSVRAVARGPLASTSMRLIGDSVGLSMTESSTAELPALLDGVFITATYDTVQNRCTAGCSLSGVSAASSVPIGTDLVVVELGYNDSTSNFGARIDSMMTALRSRQVERVVWINLSVRTGRADHIAANQALAAARNRWSELFVLDWSSYSSGFANNHGRWFASDGIHLTATGQAEMAYFVRTRLLPLADFPVGSSLFSWDAETGAVAVRSMSDYEFRVRTEGFWHTAFDMVAGGDFDRDGSVDEIFVWNRDSGGFSVQSTVNYIARFKYGGTFPLGYDEAVVGDYDSDGYVNDMFLWDRSTGHWRIYSFSNFRPTQRATGTWSKNFDVMVVGDFDWDGKLDDMMVWDVDGGGWGVRSFSGFASVLRNSGRWPPGYNQAIVGDWDGDGRRDDHLLFDVQTGKAIVYYWNGFAPGFVRNMQFSSTFDFGVAADLDDDGKHNELFLFDRDAAAWQIFHFRVFNETLARAGTFSVGYDVILDGTWG